MARPDWFPPLASTTGIYVIEAMLFDHRDDIGEDEPLHWETQYLGYVKIGWARDVEKRLAQLQTGCPVELLIRQVLVLPAPYEAKLHEAFAGQRGRGEWFLADECLDGLIGATTIDDAQAVKRWLDDGAPHAYVDPGRSVGRIDWRDYRDLEPGQSPLTGDLNHLLNRIGDDALVVHRAGGAPSMLFSPEDLRTSVALRDAIRRQKLPTDGLPPDMSDDQHATVVRMLMRLCGEDV